uniref:F-box domain-containing protein n=1 Tax=Quercus lobata TaxID=97700 RepID=A0A7N2MG23_QUELO
MDNRDSIKKRICHSRIISLRLKDRISQLPDEILTNILYLLPVKEAARTSVLSRRWKNLWTYVPSLIIKDYMSSPEMELRPVRRCRFILDVFCTYNPSQELTILLDYDGTTSRDVNEWINFAMENWVKMLDLNLEQYYTIEKKFPVMKDFPLTKLFLTEVNVIGEVLEHYVSNCPFLEELYVSSSNSLVNLRLVDQPPKLSSFQVAHCSNLENLEISAPNLVSFGYVGPKIKNMTLRHVPLLSKVAFGGKYCESIEFDSDQHASYLSQLKKLVLYFTKEVVDRTSLSPYKLPVFCNLKKVELKVYTYLGQSLHPLIALVIASPLLKMFSLEKLVENYNIWKASKHPHQCLKKIKWVGFDGSGSHVDFAKDLLDIAVSLKTFIIDTVYPNIAQSEDYAEFVKRWQIAVVAACKIAESHPGINYLIDC